MNYQKSYQKNYYQPRKPVKSFQDLEVYQKAHGCGVEIFKRISGDIEELDSRSRSRARRADSGSPSAASAAVNEIITKLFTIVLNLPVQLATAHSLRFSDMARAVSLLEEIMRGCNLAVVYLEQYRDICNNKIEVEFFEEQIKSYLALRGKIFRLQSSWKKFTKIN